MRFTLATITAATAFLPVIHAHLALDRPGVYKQGDLVSPLKHDGSNFPCSVTNFNASQGEGPSYMPGQHAEIRLSGTIVHGGGSCQISITYDQPPTKHSVWKVIKSFQGGCPLGKIPGNGDPTKSPLDPLPYVVPDSLPAGKATIAWTWFNRLGARDMYMRCHKATIGGTCSDMEAFNHLPKMFVAQIAVTNCSIPVGVNVRFPNPGLQVVGTGTGDPTGGCGKKARRSGGGYRRN